MVGLHLTQAIAYLLPDEPDTVHVELTESYRKFATEHRRQGLWDEGLYPGAAEALEILRERYRIAVVTDGLSRMQRTKAAALRLVERVDEIVFCWDDESCRKPAPGGFAKAAISTGSWAATG